VVRSDDQINVEYTSLSLYSPRMLRVNFQPAGNESRPYSTR